MEPRQVLLASPCIRFVLQRKSSPAANVTALVWLRAPDFQVLAAKFTSAPEALHVLKSTIVQTVALSLDSPSLSDFHQYMLNSSTEVNIIKL